MPPPYLVKLEEMLTAHVLPLCCQRE